MFFLTILCISILLPVCVDAQPSFRVMTFNIWNCGGNVNDGVAKIAKHILLVNPDIVAMQEVEYEKCAENITQYLPSSWHFVHPDRDYPDVMILTKHKIVEVVSHKDDAYIYAKVELPGEKHVNFWSVHAEARAYGPYLAYNKLVTNISQILSAEHAGKEGRAEELGGLLASPEMAAALKIVDQVPIVVAGDFNVPSHQDWGEDTKSIHGGWAVPWPATKELTDQGFVDSYRALFPDPVKDPARTWSTCNKMNSEYNYAFEEAQDRIDFIFYQGRVKPSRSQIKIRGLSLRQCEEGEKAESSAYDTIIDGVRVPHGSCKYMNSIWTRHRIAFKRLLLIPTILFVPAPHVYNFWWYLVQQPEENEDIDIKQSFVIIDACRSIIALLLGALMAIGVYKKYPTPLLCYSSYLIFFCLVFLIDTVTGFSNKGFWLALGSMLIYFSYGGVMLYESRVPYELVDIGANLGHPSYKNDLEEVIKRAKEAGIKKLMLTGTSEEISHSVCKLAEREPGFLYFTAGVHPHDAKDFKEGTLDTLRTLDKLTEPALQLHNFSSFDRNEPSTLAAICELIAGFMDVDPVEVARVTTENAKRIYGLE
ncbi:unnamed protein product, partial [Mesorhabditis spiculigera]